VVVESIVTAVCGGPAGGEGDRQHHGHYRCQNADPVRITCGHIWGYALLVQWRCASESKVRVGRAVQALAS
jgi:hypothetical protein